MSRLPHQTGCIAIACLALVFSHTQNACAQTVTWGATTNAPAGILGATEIPRSTASPNSPVRYVNVNGDGYDIVVTTSGLATEIGHGGTLGPSWFFEGPDGGFANVQFSFFDTNNPTTPFSVSGVHFRIEDVDEGEVFKEFKFVDGAGGTTTLASSSSVFTFATGNPHNHVSTGSFDTGAQNAGGTQPNKWIDVDFTSTEITSFSFRPGRLSSNVGSVEMMALGAIVPFVDAGGGGAPVAAGGDYRGISADSASGLGTLASLLDGTAASATSVTMAFNTPGPGLFAAQDMTVHSDVLSLSGSAGDKFVLQMTYDPTGVADESLLYLAWFDGINFVPAVDGNIGASEVVNPVPKLGAYDPLTDFLLGNYGVDTFNNTVWAVVDHNSEFVAAPEPSSAILAICGALPLLLRRRRAKA